MHFSEGRISKPIKIRGKIIHFLLIYKSESPHFEALLAETSREYITEISIWEESNAKTMSSPAKCYFITPKGLKNWLKSNEKSNFPSPPNTHF